MQRVILHVDMDAFYASVEQNDNPSLKGKPVIVGSPPDKRGVVSAASYEARKYGVHSAMPSSEAGRKCPNGVFLPPNMKRYSEVSAQILKIFERFTPFIEPLSLDEAFLDVSGAGRVFGDGPAIARKIRAAIKSETGLTASVGVAHNKLLAKIASDMNKPDGLTIVPSEPDKIRAFLAPLPVGRLWGVGKVTGEALRKAGISTIGDIQRMPQKDLARLIGNRAEFFKELADGIDEREVEDASEEKSISREYTFDADESERDEVWRVLIELTEDVGRQLREAGFYASGVNIKLRWQGFETLTRQMKLSRPVMDDQSLLAGAKQLFDRERLIKPVRLVGFGTYGLLRNVVRQEELFDNGGIRTAKNERLSRVIDGIRSKYGQEGVFRGRTKIVRSAAKTNKQ